MENWVGGSKNEELSITIKIWEHLLPRLEKWNFWYFTRQKFCKVSICYKIINQLCYKKKLYVCTYFITHLLSYDFHFHKIARVIPQYRNRSCFPKNDVPRKFQRTLKRSKLKILSSEIINRSKIVRSRILTNYVANSDKSISPCHVRLAFIHRRPLIC